MPLIDSGPIEEFIQNGLNSGKFGHDAIEILTEVHYAPEAVVRCKELKTTYEGIPADRLRALAEADRDGRCVVLPCKRGDACFEIGSGHGITRHTVKGITVYSRGADGQRYLNDINNSIVIDTWAVGDDGCEWSDHYTPEEWEKAPKTRAEAEAALAKEDKP